MRARRAGSLAVGVGILLGVIGALHAAGTGALATPPLTSPDGWTAWMDRTDPVVAVFAVTRLVALAAAWYVGGATLLTVVADATRAGALTGVADRVTLPMLRRVLAATVTASIATGSGGGVATAASVQPAAETSTTVPGAPPTIVMHRLSDDEAAPTSSPSSPPPSAGAAAAGGAPHDWRVAPGQCFWTIADDVLTAAWGRPASDAEIVPYWQRLIEANRAVLADPDNPHLIFPGQVFQVPNP